MGSLTSPPRSTSTSASPENLIPRTPSASASPLPQNFLSHHGLYVAFSFREHSDATNFSSVMGCYDPFINTWSHECLIPELGENHVLKGFAMISIGSLIYIIGGRVYRKEMRQDSHEQFSELDIEVRSSVLRYNHNSKKWSTCAPLNTPRYDFACVVCDNKIYVAGCQSTLEGARGISSAEAYDPLLNQWTSLPCMSTLRYKCVGVTWQGNFLVIGGFTDSGNRIMPYIDRCSEVHDTKTKKWKLVTGMWQLDIPPNQIVTINRKLFSSGDCLNAWKVHIEAYDGNLNIWYIVEGSQKKNLLSSSLCSYNGIGKSESIQRMRLTMAPIGTHLYFLAGYRMVGDESSSSCCTMSMVHRFDTSATSNQ